MEFMLPETDWQPPTELPDLRGRGRLAIDVETRDDGLAADRGAGWVNRTGYITGVTISSPDRSVYAPVRHPDTSNLDTGQVVRWLHAHTHESPGDRKTYHNAPYDIGWIETDMGISPPPDGEMDDTMAGAFILDENWQSYSLDNCCARAGIPGKDEAALRAAAEAYGFDPKSEMWRLPARFVGPYAEQDGRATVELAEYQAPQLTASGLWEAYQLEVDLIPMCVAMRRRGIRIDVDGAMRLRDQLLGERDAVLRELSEKAAIGRQWDMRDVNSDHFLARIFDAAGVPYPKTAKGNDSFSTEWMSKRDHWLPRLVSRAMKLHDAGDKFVSQYILGYAHMGRIHSEMHSYRDDRGGTVTTRFSYSDPPLQQMPSRDEVIAPAIRGLFLPEEGELWAACDYSQQEYRLIVHFAYLCGMLGADRAVERYLADPRTDFHDLVASLTGLPRRRAKDVNFAKAFGAGVRKFALMTGMTEEEAAAVMEQYDGEMPFVKLFNEFCDKRAQQRGYLLLLDGARGRFDTWEPRWTDWKKIEAAREAARAAGRPLPVTTPARREEAYARTQDATHPWYGERLRRAFTHKAMNKLIQGSAARQTKLAMRAMWREGILPLIQMHDELSLSTADERTAERTGELMRDVVKLEVPVATDVEFGVTWGRAAKVKVKDKVTGREMVTYGATYAEARAELEQRRVA